MKKRAVITGANGGIGRYITTALAREGFHVIMACRNIRKAAAVCEEIRKETGNKDMEVRELDLASLASVSRFTERLLTEDQPIHLLINNAGVLTADNRYTEDGLETLVSVNYIAPYLLTRRLLPLMPSGARIINTASCTYRVGKVDERFLKPGGRKRSNRLLTYADTKLALLLFTRELAERVKEKDITVCAADPGIVDTGMIRMNAWFDPLADIFFRPLIKTAKQGAETAIRLALSEKETIETGSYYANCRQKPLPTRIRNHPFREKLWNDTEKFLLSLKLPYHTL